MSIEGGEYPLEEEYKKNTGITSEDVRSLRQWLTTQPHLPEKHITDLEIILAYHACNRSSSVTKDVVDIHFTLKTLFTAYFKDRCFDDKIEAVISTVLLCPLPTRTKEGYVIFYTHLLNTDARFFNFTESIKAVFMIFDAWQHEEGTWPGMVLAIDFKDITLRHVAKIDLLNLQRFLYFLQQAMLLQIKGFHFLNAPTFIDKIITMMKPFIEKELWNVLGVHTAGSKEVEKYIPITALPKDFGGNYKSAAECAEDVSKMLRRNKGYFEEENKKRVIESLRPGKPKTIGDIFGGMEGSFKKLEID